MAKQQRTNRIDLPQLAIPDENSRAIRRLLAAREVQGKSEGRPLSESEFQKYGLTLPDIAELVAAECLASEANGSGLLFELTGKGERICGEVMNAYQASLARNGAPIPHWDSAARLLTLDGRVIKHFRRTAPNQERLLSEFEKLGWPECIDSPLPDDHDIVPSERLRETIKRLNRSLKVPLIHFRGDGTGRAVRWNKCG